MGVPVVFIDSAPLAGADEGKKATLRELLLATVSFCGVQFGWALQIAFLTPFAQILGVSDKLAGLIWFAGPIAGFVVQPTLGAWSDRLTSKWGRRRPFILAGALLIILALTMISNSVDLGYAWGDDPGTLPGQSIADRHNPSALILYILGFVLLDFSNNTLQGPGRTLVVDVAPPSQQALGNSLFSVWLAIGNIAGYLAGYVSWHKYFPFMQTDACHGACADLRTAFTISAVLLTITTSLTVFGVKEKQYVPPEGQVAENPLRQVVASVFKMPKQMKLVCIIQFFSWFAWFAYLMYATDWVAKEVFGGDPSAEDEETKHLYKNEAKKGVQFASLGLSLNALIAFLFSLLTPRLISRLGHRIVWFLGNRLPVCVGPGHGQPFELNDLLFSTGSGALDFGKSLSHNGDMSHHTAHVCHLHAGETVLGLCLVFTWITKTQGGAMTTLAIMGIAWAVTMTVPFSLVAVLSPPSERGLFMGVLNIFVVIPQLVFASFSSLIISLTDHGLSKCMVLGGASALLSCGLVWLLPAHPVSHQHEVRSREAGGPSTYQTSQAKEGKLALEQAPPEPEISKSPKVILASLLSGKGEDKQKLLPDGVGDGKDIESGGGETKSYDSISL